jgi:septum formation protein
VPVILASRSPQRRAILEQLGIPFEVRPAEIVELEHGAPEMLAVENARRKARAVAQGEALVLGVDTVVALGDSVYGKPADLVTARATLEALSGRRHAVISGLCLIEGQRIRTSVARTLVRFRTLEEPIVDWYLESGEWHDRAGGYAIQGRGAALVAEIEGDYLNVVGLPVAALLDMQPGLLAK